MLFNSYIFWVFFGLVVVLYRLLNHRGQNRMLLLASYVFYGWWDWRFLSLILISTVIDYFAAIRISTSNSQRRRKLLVALSACTNLGLLGVFKYYGFFSKELAAFFNTIHIPFLLPSMEVILPVGISFYTFQTMSYTIDVYRGRSRPTRNFLDFALYVCFFPQLVAGPIERSSRLMPQIVNPRKAGPDNFSAGMYLVLMGLFKKIVIADNMAGIVNTIFSKAPASLSGFEVMIGVYAFAFQIYGDFSGYSSIARGVARWLGFDLMVNFRMPYLAKTPSEFWRRWHISLSSWLRDYLYIPLGGNRRGRPKMYRNLMLTMLLGGLWHGANWTFIAWGFFHGLLLCVCRFFKVGPSKDTDTSTGHWWKRAVGVLIMFHLVCAGWLLFRSQSIAQAAGMAERLVTDWRFTDFGFFAFGMIVFYVAPLVVFEYWLERKNDLLHITKVHWVFRSVAYCYLVLMIWFFLPKVHHEFIYFQF